MRLSSGLVPQSEETLSIAFSERGESEHIRVAWRKVHRIATQSVGGQCNLWDYASKGRSGVQFLSLVWHWVHVLYQGLNDSTKANPRAKLRNPNTFSHLYAAGQTRARP
jgi:hypothetical protein